MYKQTSSGHKELFEKVYESYFSFFYEVAIQFLHHEDDAKGTVQEAFIKLWENKIYTKSEPEVKNYLFIVVRNQCLNILRQRKKNFPQTDSYDFLLASINYKLISETGEDILLYSELLEKVQLAIANLTPQSREVFKLSRFEELSNKEIAEKLSITVKAVEANMTRALKSLREELMPYLKGTNSRSQNQKIKTILLSFL
ncbi:RNA polymerase sigma-70 factor [Sunxiuqinia sp. A32]|uniref:RNA polymerase sigma-70 factor n=1 Tax=Sunxiuqinia sp. A32 TaxID=3461496 RepID=UPI0040452C96